MVHPIEIGLSHTLAVVEIVAAGVLLDANGLDLFLPSHLTPDDVRVGDPIEVFIYCDHDGAPAATTWVPAATLGQFAHLKCVAVTQAGAYLDWGVPKDLYVPPDRQVTRMVEGRSYVVAVCLDLKGERLIGSAQLAKHFDYDVEDVEPDQEVQLLVHGHSDAGVQVVVDQRYRGLIHRSEVHRSLSVGAKLPGYIRRVRDDNRLDIALSRRGAGGILDARDVILAALNEAGGTLALHDKSPPEDIKRVLGMSKKAFKRGTGSLYKARKIVIDERGISLVEPPQ